MIIKRERESERGGGWGGGGGGGERERERGERESVCVCVVRERERERGGGGGGIRGLVAIMVKFQCIVLLHWSPKERRKARKTAILRPTFRCLAHVFNKIVLNKLRSLVMVGMEAHAKVYLTILT